MGLVKVKNDKVMPLYDLYWRYFNERLWSKPDRF